MPSQDRLDKISIFISHASAELRMAESIANELGNNGVETFLDGHMIRAGEDFIEFMETALAEANYCLLLWSKAAASRPWVKTEWHAALARSVQEQSAFLITGRLEDIPVPRLLAARLWIDLFPHVEPGLEQLMALLRDDTNAAQATNKPVAPARQKASSSHGVNLYVTSALFDVTLPVAADLDAPAGILLGHLIEVLQLPTYQPLDTRGRIAVRVEYSILLGDRKLARHERLSEAGVREADVVTIESTFQLVGAVEPATEEPSGSTFRSVEHSEDTVRLHNPMTEASMVRRAEALMRSAVRRAGLAGRQRHRE